jgi:hypothetical protein
MDTIVSSYLSQLQIGDPRTHEHLTIFPLFHKKGGDPEYITLEEALERDFIEVTEIDQAGSVPDLKVTNKSPHAVLLLDGEEVAGAKQNRLINTSILIRGHAEITFPVSCSEVGRWAYSSRKFAHSGHISSYSIRSSKMKSVLNNLKASMGYRSDQTGVWNDIAIAHLTGGTESPTAAMKDMYEQKSGDLKEYENAFECLPDQCGCVVCLGNEVVALEALSSDDAFRRVFDKVIRSFAVEALWRRDTPADRPDHEAVEGFLRELEGCAEARHESVGEGHDFRYDSKDIVGSVLALDDQVVHVSFFRLRRHEERPRRDEAEEPTSTGDALDDLEPEQRNRVRERVGRIRGVSPR